jgi:hypothetical protein
VFAVESALCTADADGCVEELVAGFGLPSRLFFRDLGPLVVPGFNGGLMGDGSREVLAELAGEGRANVLFGDRFNGGVDESRGSTLFACIPPPPPFASTAGSEMPGLVEGSFCLFFEDAMVKNP